MAQQYEAKYVNEWLLLNYPNKPYWKRVHLGPLPKKTLARMYLVTQRWADAVIKNGDSIVLVEAKLRPTAAAVGQLLLYKDLFRQTDMFREFWGFPLKLVFLTTREDKDIKAQCDAHDIDYVVYRPKWVIDYLVKRFGR